MPSVLTVCRQMLESELVLSDPRVLIDAINYLTKMSSIAEIQSSETQGPDSKITSPAVDGSIKRVISFFHRIFLNALNRLRTHSVPLDSENQVEVQVVSRQPTKLDFVTIYEQNEFQGTDQDRGAGQRFTRLALSVRSYLHCFVNWESKVFWMFLVVTGTG